MWEAPSLAFGLRMAIVFIGLGLVLLIALFVYVIRDNRELRKLQRQKSDIFTLLKGLKKLDEIGPFISSLEGLIREYGVKYGHFEDVTKDLWNEDAYTLILQISPKSVCFKFRKGNDKNTKALSFKQLGIRDKIDMYFAIKRACHTGMLNDYLLMDGSLRNDLVVLAQYDH